jgi:D-arabinose 1-dehydrogenase-like Zn-dependent alcohol dehydrogenase
MSELIDGLGPNGELIVVGATADPIEVTPMQLINGSRTIQGWAAGTPADSEDTLHFAELTGVRPMIEKYPLEKAAEAYARMMSGKAQFRVVLTMCGWSGMQSRIAASAALRVRVGEIA